MFRDFKNYEVYEDGRIWSYHKNDYINTRMNMCGYLLVNLRDNNNNQKTYSVHRVVYESVTGQPIPEGMQVNHINEDKTDNRFENLNLLTPKENNNWGTKIERTRQKCVNHPKTSKQVAQYDLAGNLLNVWPSQKEIERQLGYDQGHISHCCCGRLKTYKGFIWRYLDSPTA